MNSRRGQAASAQLKSIFDAKQRDLNDRNAALQKRKEDYERQYKKPSPEATAALDQWNRDSAQLKELFGQ